MHIYDSLVAEPSDIEIVENAELPQRIMGLYFNEGNDTVIFLSRNIGTSAEKVCILAEELGHHYTSHGNILDQSNLQNKKQELRARAWATERILPLDRFIAAFEYGCRNRFEAADFLDVTEEFIAESVEYYKRKYGTYAAFEGYLIYFEPLGVMKMFVR